MKFKIEKVVSDYGLIEDEWETLNNAVMVLDDFIEQLEEVEAKETIKKVKAAQKILIAIKGNKEL